jgi:hypothetical protein
VIYRNKKQNQSVGYVTKTSDRDGLLQEIKALDSFGKLNLNEAYIPKIIVFSAIGSLSTLFTTFAPGQPISGIFEKIAKFPDAHPKKNAAFKTACEASQSLGKALGELHSKLYGDHYVPLRQVKNDISILMYRYHKVKEFADTHQLTLPHTLEELKDLASKFKKEPGFASFVCDDPHSANFLFDRLTSKVSFVDVSGVYISSKGLPEGIPLYQFHMTFNCLKEQLMELNVSKMEYNSILKSYEKGYASTFLGDLFVPNSRFYKVATHYTSIFSQIENLDPSDAFMKLEEEKIKKFIYQIN